MNSCTPWSIRAWPPVLWQAGCDPQLCWRHIGTHVSHPSAFVGASSGQTLWAGSSGDGEAGVAWDWIQLRAGVVAMADPMTVVTNLRLIGDEGEVLTATESARYLNAIVHALPWQDEVQRALLAA